MKYCKVLPLEGFVGELSYKLPDSLEAQVGYKVIIPLGPRIIQGLVTGVDDNPPDMELKEIISVTTNYPLFDEQVLETSLIADATAFCNVGHHLTNFLFQPSSPKIVKIVRHTGISVSLSPSEKILSDAVEYFGGTVKLTTLNKNLGKKKVTYALRKLISKGVLEISEEIISPKVSFEKKWKMTTPPENEVEEKIIEVAHLATSKAELARLSGVSSYKINKLNSEGKLKSFHAKPKSAKSGLKTPGFSISHSACRTPDERASDHIISAQKMLAEDRSIVIVCPSISACRNLTEKMKNEVSNIFLCIGGLGIRENSSLSQALEAKAPIVVVGMQSALLLPLPNLSKIIVDEPLSPYMDISKPHTLHLANLAKIRAKTTDCQLIFSGTPVSMESIKDNNIPEQSSIDVELINMVFELAAFEQPLLSAAMATAISNEVGNGGSVLVYLSRKGFSNFVVCSECNEVLRCPKCNIPLTYTKINHLVKCRYCDYQAPAPDLCPSCGGVSIRFKAGGTERLFLELNKRLLHTTILRADGDTKNSAKNIRAFREGIGQVLVGTSMILDRVDFNNVNLVCIASVDTLLSMPVFSASHKAYSIISILRGRFSGRLMLQTYLPLHPLIKSLANDRLDEFLEGEFSARQEAEYPPFTYILFWHIISKNSEKARQDAINFSTKLMKICGEENVIPPNKGYFHRLKGEYRWDIMSKTNNTDTFAGELRKLFFEMRENGVRVECTNPNK